MSKLAKALTAAAGNAGESLYVEDVFSTYLYEGFGSTQTITNGIDLSGEGGLVWLKNRDGATNHRLYTTDLYSASNSNLLQTNLTSGGSNTGAFELQSFNSNGFTLGYSGGAYSESNAANTDYASWTFRKAEKFFDVVTYTGDGVDNRQIPHNLGSTPAVIIVKSTSSAGQWPVYHQSLGTGAVRLNLTNAYNSANIWWKTTPTDSHFTVYGGGEVNVSGIEYVAYLFASDAGGFGDDGSESIIKCGSYTGNGSTTGPEIDCGFEPQWLLIKRTSNTGHWRLYDSMRGWTVGNGEQELYPNLSAIEYAVTERFSPQSTGFKVTSSDPEFNGSGENYIYIAIRRPMKTPESGTEVFAPVTNTGTGSSANITTNFPVDLTIVRDRNNTDDDRNFVWDRLRGNSQRLTTQNTGAEQSAAHVAFDYQDKITTAGTSTWFSGANYIFWNFKRATGFFDVVAYTGDGVAGRTVAHNLGIAPEMIIIKRRESVRDWGTGFDSLGWTMRGPAINSTEQAYTTSLWWNNTAPTNTEFTLGTSATTNGSSGTYIAYLFATLAGVSKVGSYTGTGSNVDVDCGFSAGARFILIKRTDSTGDWYVWDSVRGIVAGNDPYLLLNSTAAEVTSTDYIDPLSSGFTVTSAAPAALNASGGSYIFYAVA